MDTWGVDQRIWEDYEKNPDLNSGVLDFKKPEHTGEVDSRISDLLLRSFFVGIEGDVIHSRLHSAIWGQSFVRSLTRLLRTAASLASLTRLLPSPWNC